MALQRQPPVEIPFGGTLDQNTAEILRGHGTMRRVANGDQTKRGGVRKRRGHRLLPLATTTHGETIETVKASVATYEGELVVYGRNNLYGVHADTNIVDGHSVTLRGPTMIGDWSRVDVHSAPLSEET